MKGAQETFSTGRCRSSGPSLFPIDSFPALTDRAISWRPFGPAAERRSRRQLPRSLIRRAQSGAPGRGYCLRFNVPFRVFAGESPWRPELLRKDCDRDVFCVKHCAAWLIWCGGRCLEGRTLKNGPLRTSQAQKKA